MTPISYSREDYERFKKADAAFRTGDLDALRVSVGDPDGFPNVRGPKGIECSCLQYAIYHSPLAFVRTLLELGADPNYDDADGFPALIAALSCASAPDRPGRGDLHELLELPLASGADPRQRGTNDYTALHQAAAMGDLGAVQLLLRYGADPNARTRIDDCETASEVAERAGHAAVAELLRRGGDSRAVP